ncbi:uncharacterized protein LOC128236276 [Mya arenaria]|uniref:uncharacterized protein LOC128236276 n=1 Tax=Mya arenaria TaxID=6604 RepID=UPI0022E4215C|nr:uncharacterized protein LOC128236276 [Mya arenaria]
MGDSHLLCEATTTSPAPSTPWTSSSQILSNATTVKSNDATESSTVRQTVKGDIKIGYSDSSRSTALLTGIGIGAGVVLVAVALGGLFFMFGKYVQARNPSRINIMEKPLNKGSIAKVYVNETFGAPLAYTPKK